MQKNASTSLKWLLQVSGRQQRPLWAAIIISLLQVLVTLVAPVVIYLVIDGLLDDSLSYRDAMLLSGTVVAALVLRYLCMFSAAFFAHKAAFQLIGEIKIQLLNQLSRLPMAFVDRHRSSDIRQIIHDDVDRIELFVAHQIGDFVTALFAPVATFLLLFWMDWRLALVALLPLPLALLMQAVLFRGYEEKVRTFYDTQVNLNRQATQFIRGVASLRMFTGGSGGMGALQEGIDNYTRMLRQWIQEGSWPYALLKVSLDTSLLLLLPLSAFMVLEGDITVAMFVLFMMLGLGLMEPFYNTLMLAGSLNQILAGVERIRAIEQATPARHGDATWPTEAPAISLEQVNFSYPGCGEAVLKDISLAIRAGEKIAVVGASGSGKSTLLHLLAGFYPSTSGKLMIGDKPLSGYAEAELYGHTGIVLQHNHIFSDTVRNNIAMGAPVSDQQIWQALAMSEADEFIYRRPGQLDDVLGGHNVRLSGGEQQRLAIARAVLRPANLYLFDEATSFFDPLIEQRLMKKLFTYFSDAGFVFVTHRLPLACQADRIIVMHHGEVVGFDNHDNLIVQCPRYRSLVDLAQETDADQVEKEHAYV